MSKKHLISVAVQAAILGLVPVAGWGQSGDSGILEEIVVTAQKREENIQDIPMSVSTLKDDRLEAIKAGGADIRILRGRLPSLNIESSFGRAFPRFYIRGYGNTDFDLNSSQPVSLVYDEVIQENPVLKGFPIFDVDRVEMLRGPQGTLFGRNTPAGIVKFDSRLPDGEPGGYAQLSYGRFGALNFEGAVTGAISDEWSVRLAGIYQTRDDWVDNGFTGEDDAYGGYDEYALRLLLRYDNGDNFSALFNLHARDLDGTARLFRANIIQPGSNDFVAGFSRDDVFYDGLNQQDLESSGWSAKLEWDLGRTTITSVTGYESVEVFSRGDIDGGFGAVFAPPFGPGFIPFTAESADGIPDHDQWTQEFRWSSNDWGQMDWQVGFFWFSEELTIDTFNFDTLAGDVINGRTFQDQETDAWALFGSIDYEINEKTVLQAGLRYSDEEKDFVASRSISPLAFLGVGPIGPIRVNPSDSDVSGDIAVTYYINDDVNVYGRIARGFRAPSIQGRLLFGDVVSVAESETSTSFEAGVKSTLWGGRARLNASVFSYTVDDIQLTAVGGATNFNTLINAEEATGQGFEVELEALLGDNFVITAAASYNDTEIEDSNLGVQPCAGGCTVLDPPGAVDGVVSIDGNPLPQAPEWVFNATARWGQPMWGGDVYVLADYFYRDDVNFFLYESAEFRGDAFGELGLRVGYQWDNQEVAVFGRNITDEEELVGGIDFNNLTGFVNEPRTWAVEYRINF